MRERDWRTKPRFRGARDSHHNPPRERGDKCGVVRLAHASRRRSANPARHIRRLLATENALRRSPTTASPCRMALEAGAARRHRRAAHARCRASGPLRRSRSPALARHRGLCPPPGSCWCSIRSPIRTMSAPFCAPPPPSLWPPSSPPRATARRRPACWPNPPPARSNWCRSSACRISRAASRRCGSAAFSVVGLDSEADDELAALPLAAPLALVLGAEGKGLRQGTRAVCERLARLDLPGAIKSLNVSNAAALALYIASRGHRMKNKGPHQAGLRIISLRSAPRLSDRRGASPDGAYMCRDRRRYERRRSPGARHSRSGAVADASPKAITDAVATRAP